METPKPPQRLYKGADATMLTEMSAWHNTFTTTPDAGLFANVNPEFGGTFAAEWATAIKLAGGAGVNVARQGVLTEKSGTVTQEKADAATLAKRVLYYATEAFPGNAGRLTQFGKSLYDGATTSPAHMQELLELQIKQVTLDEAALGAKGWPLGNPANPTDPARGLNQLRAALAELGGAKTTQLGQKGANQEDTAASITLLNNAYRPAQRLARAAELVAWPADIRAAKLKEYRLPDSAPESHTYTLLPGQTGARRFDGALSPGRRLSFTDLQATEGPLVVALAPDAATPPTTWVPVPPAKGPGHPPRLTIGRDIAGGEKDLFVVLRNDGPGLLSVGVSLLEAK